MSSQRIVAAPLVANIISMFLHVLLCFLYTRVADMGVYGLALAASTKDFVLWLSLAIYCYCAKQIRQTLAPLNRSAFEGWCGYLKISGPATLMTCAEWWASELLVILAGTLGVAELASETIIQQVTTTMFMTLLGI